MSAFVILCLLNKKREGGSKGEEIRVYRRDMDHRCS